MITLHDLIAFAGFAGTIATALWYLSGKLSVIDTLLKNVIDELKTWRDLKMAERIAVLEEKIKHVLGGDK